MATMLSHFLKKRNKYLSKSSELLEDLLPNKILRRTLNGVSFASMPEVSTAAILVTFVAENEDVQKGVGL
jgi:hypothetical protein